jgi:hypothetical protein
MQTKTLHIVLDYLQDTFHFDKDETRKLLVMLRKTLADALPILKREDTDSIYHRSHKLHSEFQICGHQPLSDLAQTIERQAKKGIIEREKINDLLTQCAALNVEIGEWLG